MFEINKIMAKIDIKKEPVTNEKRANKRQISFNPFYPYEMQPNNLLKRMR